MDDEVIEQVAAIDLFHVLPRGQVRRMVDSGERVQHPDGEEVTSEGGPAATFHFILGGQARVEHAGQQVAMLGPGDYFGEISLIDGLPRSATVVAEGGLETLAIRRESFTLLIRGNPGFAEALNVVLCARVRNAEARS